MQVELFSPTLGSLELTASSLVSGRDFDLLLANYDMGSLQPNLAAIYSAFGSIESVTGYTNRTPTFHVAVRAEAEFDRVAGGEALAKWLNSGDCELRYTPADGPTSCLIVLAGYVVHVNAPSGDDDRFMTEWRGVGLRWYEVHVTAAPQVLALDVTTATLAGAGIAAGAIEVDGTFPAAATVTATSNTGLGKTVIYTSPVDYMPGLRAHLTSSSASLSRSSAPHFFKGTSPTSWKRLNGAVFSLAASDLPAGDYAFVANVFNQNAAAAACLPTLTIATAVGGNPVDNFVAGSMGVTVAGSSEAMMSLGAATIDRAGVSDGAESSTSITLTVGNLPTDLYFDEVFAFRVDPASSLTMLDAGTGAPALGSSHSLAAVSCSPRPGQVPNVVRGLASDVTKSLGPGSALGQMEAPMLPPGENFAYVASAGVDAALAVQVDYRSAHATYADYA